MSTSISLKTRPNYSGRWRTRLFDRMDSVKIVRYVGVYAAFTGRNVHLPRLPVIHDQSLGVGGVDAFSGAVIKTVWSRGRGKVVVLPRCGGKISRVLL